MKAPSPARAPSTPKLGPIPRAGRANTGRVDGRRGVGPPLACRIAVAATVLGVGACSGDPREAVPGVGRRSPTAEDAGTPPVDAGFVRPATPELPEADAELVVPFRGTGEYFFTLQADLGRMDVHFSVDTTSSISGEIDELQASLERRLIPRLRRRVDDVAFGVSRFEDFPVAPFGTGIDADLPSQRRPDTPFALLTGITDSRSRLNRALYDLDDPLGLGGDGPEAGAEALFQIATGEGIRIDGVTFVEPFDATRAHALGSIGGVGFREGALPVIVHITDAPTHGYPDRTLTELHTHSLDATIEALVGINARVIGIASGACKCGGDTEAGASAARDHLRRIAFGTGSVMDPDAKGCPTGIDGSAIPPFRDTCPLVFEVDDNGAGLSDTVSDAIAALLDGLRFDRVDARVSDDPLGFVAALEASVVEPAGADPVLEDRQPAGQPDGIPDTLRQVGNRTVVGYRVLLHNDVIAPADRDQRFRVVVTVHGDGLVVAEVVLRVVVPAGSPDAGMHWSDEDAG